MAPAKRAASKPAAGRAQKAAKVAAPGFAILAELKRGGVPASCVDMIAAALPHVLEVSKEERHQFQTTVFNQLEDATNKERTRREDVLASAELAAADFDEAAAAASEKATVASAEEASRKEKKSEFEVRARTVAAAADAAMKTLNEAKSKSDDARGDVARAEACKESFATKVGELWPALRDATFEKKDWRLRQKAITQVMLLFKPISPESLIACLPLALKEGLDARGAFAQKVVQEAERILNGHAEQLNDAIAAAKTASSECDEEVTRVESLSKDADLSRDQAQDDCIKVENEWVVAQQESFTLAQFIRDVDTTRKEHEAAVQQAKASIEALDAAFKALEAVEEPPTAAEPAAEPAETEEAVSVEPVGLAEEVAAA